MSELDDHYPDLAEEISTPTEQAFTGLVASLGEKSQSDVTEEVIFAGPWTLADGRKLSVYMNNGENHTSSHEVTLTDTITNPSSAKVEVDEVYARPYYGKWTKETMVHDVVEKRLIELSLPSWEVNPFNPDPSEEALAAEEERQVALLQLEMAQADNEGFGIPYVDEAAIVEVNRLMSELLSSL